MLSTCVTFSNQTVLLMVLTTLFPNRYLQDIITLYGIIICLVFYGIIIPINGLPSSIGTMLVDMLIHITVPVLYIIQKGSLTFVEIPFLHFMVYPAVYFVFVQVISWRRGYMIYPFLNSVPGIVAVVIVFGIVHWCSQRNKK